MAVEFDVKMSRTGEYWANPEDLEVTPELNGRHELPDIEALIDSILTHGQLQPVTIRSAAKMPVLVAGFSRWRAITAINQRKLFKGEPLKVRCSYTKLTETQAFLANIEENRVRNQTTPIDDAYNIQRLINVYQFTEAKAASAYRMSITWIRDRLQLLELTPEAEKAVRDGRVSDTAAVAISKLKKTEQHKVLAKTEGTITKKDVVAPKPKTVSTGDVELTRLISNALEDVADMVGDPEQGKWISVDRIALLKIVNHLGLASK